MTAATTTLTKTVHVENKRPTGAASYTIAYEAAHPTPGVTYTFSPSQISLPAGGSADVKVTATITKSALRAVEDPTTSSDPLDIGLQRNYRADASGRMVLTPAGITPGGKLRVPVWSAPRPASAMAAAASTTVSKTGPLRLGSLPLAVRPSRRVRAPPATSRACRPSSCRAPARPSRAARQPWWFGCIAFADDRSADLRYVGSASDAQLYDDLSDSFLSFGVSSYGPWRTPASYTEFDVKLDTNGDTVPDAVVYNTRVTTTDDYDYFLAELVDLRDGSPTEGEVLDDELINGVDGSFDTNLFNSDSLVLPVWVGALKDAGLVTDGSTKVKYWVESLHRRGRSGRQGGLEASPDDAHGGCAWAGRLRRLRDDAQHRRPGREPGRGAQRRLDRLGQAERPAADSPPQHRRVSRPGGVGQGPVDHDPDHHARVLHLRRHPDLHRDGRPVVGDGNGDLQGQRQGGQDGRGQWRQGGLEGQRPDSAASTP